MMQSKEVVLIDHLPGLIRAFKNVKALLLGDAVLDTYLVGASSRLCREAPVPIVDVERRENLPGGAANTAVNLRALGAEVRFISVVGADREGELLLQALENRRVSSRHIVVTQARKTVAKSRVLAGDQMLARFDQGSSAPLDGAIEYELIARLKEAYPRVDAVIVSDYNCGTITPKIIAALGHLQSRYPRVLVVDSRTRLGDFARVRPTAVKPNYDEALRLLAKPAETSLASRPDEVTQWGEQILAATGAQIAALTLDSDGAILFEKAGDSYRTYPPSCCRTVAGAGDAFVAAMALALAAGAETTATAEIAAAASAVVVDKERSPECSAEELLERIFASGKLAPDSERLSSRLEQYRKQGRKIVFTNGCFDILHRGHVTYLSRAKALGDVLVLGVNSDSSVRRLKGDSRPINSLSDRVHVLAALSCVDHIIPFDAETASDLIRTVRPDIYVKGGDYTKEKLPEAPVVEEMGGVVQILPLLQARSTTGIIERIRDGSGSPEQREQGANGTSRSSPLSPIAH
jgi:D-beta-D-heptose 7-phosphate kinase / D-beta-D-heptose 1-phosphate adenosyltransferase